MNPIGAAKKMAINILPVSSADLEEQVASFTELFKQTVNGGASLGYVAPLTHNAARDYWLSLRSELDSGVRLLLAAYAEEELVGAGQLFLPYWPAARHRAEVHKLLVGATMRGQGVGKRADDRSPRDLQAAGTLPDPPEYPSGRKRRTILYGAGLQGGGSGSWPYRRPGRASL